MDLFREKHIPQTVWAIPKGEKGLFFLIYHNEFIKKANIQPTLVNYSKSFAYDKRRMYNILREFFISEKAHIAVSIRVITRDIPVINKAISSRRASYLCLKQQHFDKKYSVQRVIKC